MKPIRVFSNVLDKLLEMEESYWVGRRRPICRKAFLVTDGIRSSFITDKVFRKMFPRTRSQFGRTANYF